MKLPGWGRRLKVASSWTLDLLLPADLVELKLSSSNSISQEHFEPGEEVFHQGDLGDRIYIIINGEAEVVREDGGREMVLARLGAGEYFGEMALLRQTTRSATVRCTAPMDALSLHKREFGLLTTYLPDLKESLTHVMERRNESNEQKFKKVGGD
jgi:NADH dehydrogenase